MNYRTTALRADAGADRGPLRVTATVATADPINGEILDMRRANLGRFDAGAVPLLVDHAQSARAVVGSVEALRIEADRLVADLLITDAGIAESIRRGASYNVSIGYTAPDARGAWELLEISLVGVGLDPRAGVSRSHIMDGPNPTPNPTPTPNPAPAPADDAGMKAERERTRQLLSMAREYGVDATEAIAGGDTPETFGLAIRQRAANNGGEPKPNGAPAIIRRDNLGDPDDFSLRKLYLALADGTRCREVERTKEPATVAGARHSGGRHIPADVLRGLYRRRDLTTAAASAAELVGTDHMGGEFVEPLREYSFSGAAGVRILDGLTSNIEIPRQDAVSMASWLDESTTALAASEPGLSEIELSPKGAGVMASYSRRLLLISDPSVEAWLREDQARTLALAVDAALLRGTGLNDQPKGVLAYTGSQLAAKISTTNGTPMTFNARLVGAENQPSQAADGGRNVAFGSRRPRCLGKAELTTKLSGEPIRTCSKAIGWSGVPYLETNLAAHVRA